MWLTGTSAVAAGAVVVALQWPNTAPKEPPVSTIPLHIDYRPPKAVKLKLHDRAMALGVASKFIFTAVARKNIDRSWTLVAPEFRAGLTRRQWDTGNIPVVPYPVGQARWKLEYSDVEGVGFQMGLFPPKGVHQRPQVFLIGLHQLKSGTEGQWVVDSWQSAPIRSSQAAGGSGGGNVVEQASPQLSGGSKARESAAWLLLPVGLLSLIVVLPLGIGGVNWYRGRRAQAKAGV